MATQRRFTVTAVGFLVAGALLPILVSAARAAAPDTLIPEQELGSLFAGSDVHLDMSRKTSHGWAGALWKFSADGSLSGYLWSSAYTASQEPRNGIDAGRWRVNKDRLCIQWAHWDGGQERCYGITGRGGDYTATGASGLLAGPFTLVVHR